MLKCGYNHISCSTDIALSLTDILCTCRLVYRMSPSISFTASASTNIKWIALEDGPFTVAAITEELKLMLWFQHIIWSLLPRPLTSSEPDGVSECVRGRPAALEAEQSRGKGQSCSC